MTKTQNPGPGKYIADKPCKRGHEPVRYIANRSCVECCNERSAGQSTQSKNAARARRRAEAKRALDA